MCKCRHVYRWTFFLSSFVKLCAVFFLLNGRKQSVERASFRVPSLKSISVKSWSPPPTDGALAWFVQHWAAEKKKLTLMPQQESWTARNFKHVSEQPRTGKIINYFPFESVGERGTSSETSPSSLQGLERSKQTLAVAPACVFLNHPPTPPPPLLDHTQVLLNKLMQGQHLF